MFALEDAHWWFHGMEAIAARLLDDARAAGMLPSPDACLALDAGCGTGRNLRFLRRYSTRVTGLDYSAYALNLCATRARASRDESHWRLARGSVNAMPFRDGSFDLVTCADVLSHSAVNDVRALAEIARVLRPGGVLFLRVAAYDALRGKHDIAWSIAHRFHRPELRDKLCAAGLEVHRLSYANTWLFPVALVKRILEGLLPGADGDHDDLHAGAGDSWLGKMLGRVLASEAPWIARFPGGLPCGLSLVTLGRKAAAAPAP